MCALSFLFLSGFYSIPIIELGNGNNILINRGKKREEKQKSNNKLRK